MKTFVMILALVSLIFAIVLFSADNDNWQWWAFLALFNNITYWGLD